MDQGTYKVVGFVVGDVMMFFTNPAEASAHHAHTPTIVELQGMLDTLMATAKLLNLGNTSDLSRRK